ncbi:MAG: peptidyl-prolyl cis-trans isomerase [Candidatus Eremiobacteraeota bacterium]|nr:peptidyl-prolyl cis-trans isomerase [Candidatus Eremiobacteraeota bacterium]
MIRRQVILDKAVGANIHVTDKQIADYFSKNHAQFDQPATAHARHILVPDLKTATKVEADLKAGKDFAAEAKQYSVDPGSRDKGGDLGWFRKGQMVPAFEAYAFTAPLQKISAPVKSPFGYHVIQVEDRKIGQKATLASAHDQIVQQLKQQQEAPLIQPFLLQLQQKANIQVNDPKFQSIFPTPQPSAAPTK